MEDIKLLMTIPGIGSLLATIICAEIVNINRFKSCKAFASYTGLVPTIKVSGDPIYIGEITRIGFRPLKCALVEAAIRAPGKLTALSQLFFQLT